MPGVWNDALVGATLFCLSCVGVPPQTPNAAPVAPPPEPGPALANVLLVDLTAQEASRLLDDLQIGLVNVKYDGKVMTLLPGCASRGEYGFLSLGGPAVADATLSLRSEAELLVNLPAHGAGLAPKVTGGFGEGSSFELATRSVGRWVATGGGGALTDPRCTGASHWVRSVEVGAFVAATGTETAPRSADDLFTVDGTLSGGDPSACRSSADGPPAGCGRPLRAELVRLGEEPKLEFHEIGPPVVPPCGPLGDSARGAVKSAYVRVEGGCQAREHAKAFACQPGDEKECFEQCDLGSGTSCDILGVSIAKPGRRETDRAWATRVFNQGCDAGGASACTNLAIAHRDGFGVLEDRKKAEELSERACALGHARACSILGTLLEGRGASDELATSAYRRGCDSGSAFSCGRVAYRVSVGLGAPRDDLLAYRFSWRACDGGDGDGCVELGQSLEFGTGARLDPGRGLRMYQKGCNTRSDRCRDLAIAYDSGAGIDQNPGKARELFRRACKSWDMSSCAYLQILGDPDGKVGIPKAAASTQLDRATRACSAGRPRACTLEALMTRYNRESASTKLAGSCARGDAFACHLIDLLGFGSGARK